MKKRSDTCASVWDAIADTPAQAANLRARAELMQRISELIQAEGWKQVEAAERCGVTQRGSTICCAAACRVSRSTRWSISRLHWDGG